jgi:hypothetical protein
MFTRYVLENPWPLGIALLAAAVILAWTALRRESTARLRVAGLLALTGGAALFTGAAVVTPGEHARRVVLDVVAAAVAGDVAGAGARFSEDATLAFGSVTNPGLPREEIERRIDHLDGRYRIASNDVTGLRAETVARDQGTVRLGCRTVLEAAPVPVPTEWVIEVTRQSDGGWKVSRATWTSIAGRPPASDLGR